MAASQSDGLSDFTDVCSASVCSAGVGFMVRAFVAGLSSSFSLESSSTSISGQEVRSSASFSRFRFDFAATVFCCRGALRTELL